MAQSKNVLDFEAARRNRDSKISSENKPPTFKAFFQNLMETPILFSVQLIYSPSLLLVSQMTNMR